LVGMFEGALLLREPISGLQFMGAVVTLGSLMVVMRTHFSDGDPIKLEVTE
jgi:drug/metabolite transporter (DMT)-like permease